MSRSNDGESSRHLSKSFVTGAIALAFLIIGYQTALFIHRAASLKILSESKIPADTVYIFTEQGGTDIGLRDSDGTSQGGQAQNGTKNNAGGKVSRTAFSRQADYARKDKSRADRTDDVVSSFIPRRYETFRFNPNTASVDELCRLGFSLKQAESIDNYRLKGGRFRRKSDFAKSFVVADSVYKRLESYIDIPKIDLNTADSADFETLPGIGSYFASKMVSYRKMLGGYSYKEQLMDIYHFDKEKFAALEDLVEVVTPPEPFAIWSLPLDALRKHPYIRDYQTARAIVLYRQNNPASALTVDGLAKAGILDADKAEKLSGCLLE